MPAPARDDQIDRVDENDRIVGTVARDQAIVSGAGFRVVHVLVTNTSSQVLLQCVGSAGTRTPGRWGSSVAGYLFAGEEPLAAARRRMREEIDVDAPLSFLGRTRMDDEGSHKFIYVYHAQSDEARVVDTGHIAELRFWDLAEVEYALDNGPDVFTPTFAYVYRVARRAFGSGRDA